MDKRTFMLLQKAKREEKIIKSALDYSYFEKEKRDRCFKKLKEVQLVILKIHMEESNNEKEKRDNT